MRRPLGLYMCGIGPTGYEFYFLAHPRASLKKINSLRDIRHKLEMQNSYIKKVGNKEVEILHSQGIYHLLCMGRTTTDVYTHMHYYGACKCVLEYHCK